MEKNTKKTIFFTTKVVIAASIVYVVVFSAITSWVFQQPNDLLKIEYICATKAYPGTLYLLGYDNGTHTKDFNTCIWFKNVSVEEDSKERRELRTMYCSEMIDRHNSGKPYLSTTNHNIAAERFSHCAYVFGS